MHVSDIAEISRTPLCSLDDLAYARQKWNDIAIASNNIEV
jgi:hypothetical protein